MTGQSWDLVWSTSTESDHEYFIKSWPKHRCTAIHRNVHCTLGNKCSGDHNMTLRYMKYTAKECGGKCNVKMCTMYCPRLQKWYAYQLHNTSHAHEPFNDDEFYNEENWKVGISDCQESHK